MGAVSSCQEGCNTKALPLNIVACQTNADRPLQIYLKNILQALDVPELVEVLAALPCIPALELLVNEHLIAWPPEGDWTISLCESAAEAGHLEVLQWHFDKGSMHPGDAMQCAFAAAGSGNWDMLHWLMQRFSEGGLFVSVCWRQISLEHIFRLPEQQALLKLKCLDAFADLEDVVQSFYSNPSRFAAKVGYISSLQWLQDRWPACTRAFAATSAAATSGRLDVMQWLRHQETPWRWNDRTCYDAASSGHLEVLKWLRSQEPPCPFPEG